MSHQKYVMNQLKETGIVGCKPLETPIDPNHILESIRKEMPVEKGRYQRLVRKLIYFVHTRTLLMQNNKPIYELTIRVSHGSTPKNL